MGAWPFDRVAVVRDQGGALIATIASSPARPSSSSAGRTGKAYDHTANVPRSALEHVRGLNRKLRVDGVTYAIVDHEPYDFLPHVALRLRVIRGG